MFDYWKSLGIINLLIEVTTTLITHNSISNRLTELCECLLKLPKLNRRWAIFSGDSGDCGPLIVRVGILNVLSKSDRFLFGFSTDRIGSEWIFGRVDLSSSFDVSSSECGRDTFLLGAWSPSTNARTLSYRWLSIARHTRKENFLYRECC